MGRIKHGELEGSVPAFGGEDILTNRPNPRGNFLCVYEKYYKQME